MRTAQTAASKPAAASVTTQKPNSSVEARAAPTPSGYTRLHITPLDGDLANVIISSSLQPKSRNLSFHTIDTFPEKRYGFVDLPTEDAEKLRRKLHGAVLKGVKVRIEDARPSRQPVPMGDSAFEAEGSSSHRSKKDKGEGKSKKRKRDGEELSGVLLEEGRKVKRGWTVTPEEAKVKKEKEKKEEKERKVKKSKNSVEDDPVVEDGKKSKSKEKKDKKDKKKSKQGVKSKYTDQPECLVKTILPPNAAAALAQDGSSKKRKGKSREVVVHEFEHTTKFPSFLKSSAPTSGSRPAAEFVEGKGWVDEDGNVVEAVKKGKKPAAVPKTLSKAKSKSSKPVVEESESESSSESSDDEAEESDEDEAVETSKTPAKQDNSHQQDEPSSGSEDGEVNLSSPLLAKSEGGRPSTSGSMRGLTIKIPPPPSTPAVTTSKQVHPLEALYKRPKGIDGTPSQPTKEATPFSFFGNNAETDELDDDTRIPSSLPGSQVPLTPFTQQDFEERGMRSAAPTPDTAHPNRRFKPWTPEKEDDIEEEAEDEEVPTGTQDVDQDDDQEMGDATQGGEDAAPESDFQKWFYENKGSLKRSWRQRRKAASKEKRYRDNRARGERAI